MANEYFSHDYDSSNDPRLAAMIGEFNAAGYGVYWRAVEMLHKEGGYLPLNTVAFTAIARSLDTDSDIVKNVIEKSISVYKLFQEKNKFFFSKRVIKNLKKRRAIKKVKSKAGRASALSRKNSTDVQHVLNTFEHNSTKERKVNKSKEYNTNSKTNNKRYTGSENLDAEAPPPSQNEIEFEKFQKWIIEHSSRVSEMKEPFTINQFLKLKKEIPAPKFSQLLKDMHNWKPLLRNNTSAYLTILKWAKREQSEKPSATNGAYIQADIPANLKKLN